jgi:hypothetical protein
MFISLFCRLHNYMTYERGFDVKTELLHIWPTILDEYVEIETFETNLIIYFLI